MSAMPEATALGDRGFVWTHLLSLKTQHLRQAVDRAWSLMDPDAPKGKVVGGGLVFKFVFWVLKAHRAPSDPLTAGQRSAWATSPLLGCHTLP